MFLFLTLFVKVLSLVVVVVVGGSLANTNQTISNTKFFLLLLKDLRQSNSNSIFFHISKEVIFVFFITIQPLNEKIIRITQDQSEKYTTES